jgi:DNA-binding response OmpR family regulator
MSPEVTRQDQRSVLVVEDHRPLRELVQTILNAAGYNVMTAASGDEALRITKEHPVDLLLTDIGMPGMNGDTLVQQFQAQSGASRVVIMSGREPEELTTFEGAAFLQKPFTPQSLLAIVLRTFNDRMA